MGATQFSRLALRGASQRKTTMGLVYADITLLNSFDVTAAKKGLIAEGDVKKLTFKSLVDTGALTLTINEEIANQLDLKVLDQSDVSLADGTVSKCDLVGPVEIRFENRMTTCPALVLPGADEVLLGAVPLELMDVMIDPRLHRLVVHPLRPNTALMKVK